MNNSDKKLLTVKKNNPQNVIVVVGVWICAATIAVIFILNMSARRSIKNEPKAEIVPVKEFYKPSQHHYSKLTHAGYASIISTCE